MWAPWPVAVVITPVCEGVVDYVGSGALGKAALGLVIDEGVAGTSIVGGAAPVAGAIVVVGSAVVRPDMGMVSDEGDVGEGTVGEAGVGAGAIGVDPGLPAGWSHPLVAVAQSLPCYCLTCLPCSGGRSGRCSCWRLDHCGAGCLCCCPCC